MELHPSDLQSGIFHDPKSVLLGLICCLERSRKVWLNRDSQRFPQVTSNCDDLSPLIQQTLYMQAIIECPVQCTQRKGGLCATCPLSSLTMNSSYSSQRSEGGAELVSRLTTTTHLVATSSRTILHMSIETDNSWERG